MAYSPGVVSGVISYGDALEAKGVEAAFSGCPGARVAGLALGGAVRNSLRKLTFPPWGRFRGLWRRSVHQLGLAFCVLPMRNVVPVETHLDWVVPADDLSGAWRCPALSAPAVPAKRAMDIGRVAPVGCSP